MENESFVATTWRKFSDQVQDQVWFQQLKAKWDELDARSKTGLKYLGLFGSAFVLIGGVAYGLISVSDQKREIDEKLALIQKIQNAQDELRKLKEVTSRMSGDSAQPWNVYLQEKASAAGLDPSSVNVGDEIAINPGTQPKARDPKAKIPPAANPLDPVEVVIGTAIKKINVRQLARYVHEIENGGRTVKVRRLEVDTHPDESGYLDATIVVSAFTMPSAN